ncbi:hypothetical protein OHC33_004817 [Knufia fluminis]|uniref:E2 ubiquitin-conjugating enzyme n=1 Tax=Knufia fluminis TaxID=191047 RepID=A0AAN8I696_9EURO|nr:hypothetical protein OHC33_004817 [Knufia fluminis]
MAGAGQKRITKELGELTTAPPSGVIVELKDDNNLHGWKVTMDGPSGTPYSGGKFDLELTLPPNYPFKPPTVTFKTKLYHPNVSNDTPPNSGLMCLGMLRDSEWKPSTKMSAVLEYIRHLLREPDPDDAVEAKIADQYQQDKAGYEKEARDWTKRYAMGKK